ncbi:uncharacterized protein LOC131680348 [Topomyia yanbarensis]|uniref:uncharacterized protein LOC131680348 n=1 Tax=Topomyia yanbarensis TaxID=2498891 RepID=UPI00273C8BE7|nr:uncharacterized protein LOC131680348 [Topomyia yanbarensis]
MGENGLNLKLGSWLRIERAQKNIDISSIPSTSKCSTTTREDQNIEKEDIIRILENSPECQKLMHGKLAEGVSLAKNEKNLICRVLCSVFFGKSVADGMLIGSGRITGKNLVHIRDLFTIGLEIQRPSLQPNQVESVQPRPIIRKKLQTPSRNCNKSTQARRTKCEFCS